MCPTEAYDTDGARTPAAKAAEAAEPHVPPQPRGRRRKKDVLAERGNLKKVATPPRKAAKLGGPTPKSSGKKVSKPPKPAATSDTAPPAPSSRGCKGRGVPDNLVLSKPSLTGPTKEDNARVQLTAVAAFKNKSTKVHVSTLYRNQYGPNFVEHTKILAELIEAGGVTKAMALQKRCELSKQG